MLQVSQARICTASYCMFKSHDGSLVCFRRLLRGVSFKNWKQWLCSYTVAVKYKLSDSTVLLVLLCACLHSVTASGSGLEPDNNQASASQQNKQKSDFKAHSCRLL